MRNGTEVDLSGLELETICAGMEKAGLVVPTGPSTPATNGGSTLSAMQERIARANQLKIDRNRLPTR